MIKDLILKKCFVDFLEGWQLKDKNDISEATKFEMFVNYVILSQDDLDAFIGHPELLEFCSTGGGDDAKMDGIGIKINDQLVGSIDDINQIVERNKKIYVEFFLIQSKERTDFDSSAVNTFGVGARNFFSEPLLPENDKMKAIRELKDYIFSEEKVYRKLSENPSVRIFYVFCGATPDDTHTKAVKELLIQGLKNCPDCLGKISMDIVDGKSLIERCKSLENDFNVELNIKDIIPLTVQDNVRIKKAYTFTCEATELLKLLIKKEDGTLRRSLFNSNVRDYLGNSSGVNSEIEHTIVTEPEMFLMCNNGITIVCSDFIQIKDKIVSIDNPQIVNGCQTCSTIFLQRNCDSLQNVQVLVKLICTDDNSVTTKIVRGTNKQNQVLEESFETTKPFHQKIEDFFEAKCDAIKLHYERRNKQYTSIPTITKYQIVNLRVLTQSFVAIFLQKPYEAHRHEAVLLQKYAPKDEHSRLIYNPDHSSYMYYIAALTWYMFEMGFRNNIIGDKKKMRTYIAHLYYIFTFTTGQYPLNSSSTTQAIEKFCAKLEKQLLSNDFNETLKKVISVFNRSKAEWIRLGRSEFAIKDSKEFTDVITQIAREVFVNKTTQLDSDDTVINNEQWLHGEILSTKFREHWFAFIKTSECDANVYFDKRSYNGPERSLIPGKKVRFLVNVKKENGEILYFATKVEIL